MGLKGVKMKCIHWSKESRDIMYIFGASVHLPVNFRSHHHTFQKNGVICDGI